MITHLRSSRGGPNAPIRASRGSLAASKHPPRAFLYWERWSASRNRADSTAPCEPRTDEPGLVAALDSRLAYDRSPLLHLGAQVRAQALGRRADHDNSEILETRAGGGYAKRGE